MLRRFYSPVSIFSSIAVFLSQNFYPTTSLSLPLWLLSLGPLPLLFLTILIHIATTASLSFHRPVELIFFHPLLSLSVRPAAICSTRLWWVSGIRRVTGDRRQASVCMSEISQLKSQTWQITAAIQKWTITSEWKKKYEEDMMKNTRERTFRGAFSMVWGHESVYTHAVCCVLMNS